MPFKPRSIEQYNISISTELYLEQLKLDWLALEEKSNVPFFLSWAWMSTWLLTYTPKINIITAKFEGEIVAIGLLTSSTERRHFVINSKQIRLHQCGSTAQDQIWIEYNDFICHPKHQLKAVNACLKFITSCKVFKNHDEVIISMILKSRAQQLSKSIPNCEILLTRPCYGIDLRKFKTQEKTYLQSLKSNTRYQIRRSIRLYEKTHGQLQLVHAKNTNEALEFFNETAPLHIQRWYDSGFKNPDFINFHCNLITKYYPEGLVQLIKVKAGNHVIAILYYFINNSKVSFYLHGLLYEKDKMLKPGLVAHSLATQYFIDNDMTHYDYMGGYSQYKTQLASRTEDLATIQIQKPIFKFIVENTASAIKNLITRKD